MILFFIRCFFLVDLMQNEHGVSASKFLSDLGPTHQARTDKSWTKPVLLRKPHASLREFVRREELYRRGSDSGPGKSERLHLPAWPGDNSDFRNFAAVRE